MININNRTAIILILAAIFIAYIFYPNNADKPESFDIQTILTEIQQEGSDIVSSFRKRLSSIVELGGVEGSIKLVDTAFASGMISLSDCHTLLHLVGHESYQRYQGDFKYLTSSQSQQCVASFQHGIEGQIAEGEIEMATAVEKLYEYCSALREVFPGVSCYHGAGHGYMRISYDLKASLNFCDALAGGPEKDLSDCYRGIFSEYGNMALNIDGDTGEKLADEPPVKLDFERPFGICHSLDEKYRMSCFSQITKVLYNTSDIDNSFKKCIYPDYSKVLQETCVNILASIYGEVILSGADTVETPQIIYSLPPNLRQSYLSGLMIRYGTFYRSGVKKDWASVCGSFLEQADREFCGQLSVKS